MSRKHFTDKLSGMIKIQIIILVIFEGIIGWATFRMAEDEMESASENFLTLYGTQLENRLNGMDRVLGNLLYNVNLSMLESDDYLTRHYASVNFQRIMEESMQIDTNAEMVVAAEAEHDILLVSGTVFSSEEKEALKEYTVNLAEENTGFGGGWDVKWIGKHAYLYRSAMHNKRALVIYVSVDSLLNTVNGWEGQKRQVFWTDSKGDIYGTAGTEFCSIEKDANVELLEHKFMVTDQYDFLDGKFYVNLFEEKRAVYTQVSIYMAVVLGAVLLLSCFTLYMRRSVRTELIIPMKRLTEDMKKIQDGEYGLRIDEQAGAQEFHMLAVSFNKLLNEIIHLRIQYYEKRLELQEANQKYIRMQLRPHFFLNAMMTVSALNASGRNKEIEEYIQALSKNIRYMFSSGMHTVPIKEELQHVRNYLAMQELKYPDCVFHYIELPAQLEEWRIPQMLIHTLVENEYKYVISKGKTVVLLIKISVTEYEGENMLLIEVEG